MRFCTLARTAMVAACFAAAGCGSIASRTNAPANDEREIAKVAEAFRHAILEKDERTFLGLFLHDGVTWQSVMSERRLDRARTRDPQATRAAYQSDRSPAQFIREIAENPAHVEETFDDLTIDTDGAAASVAFDFRFLRDQEIVNAGREYWLLVKTDAGWKIASVVWSRN